MEALSTHEKIQIKLIVIVMLEALQRGIFQQSVNGTSLSPSGLGEPFGGASRGKSQGILLVLGFQGIDQGFETGYLARSRTSRQDTDRMGQCHVDGGLLLSGQSFRRE